MSDLLEKRFIMLCERGNLEVVKLLLQENPDIDISVNNDHAFETVCLCENLEMAKWFEEMKPERYEIIGVIPTHCCDIIDYKIYKNNDRECFMLK